MHLPPFLRQPFKSTPPVRTLPDFLNALASNEGMPFYALFVNALLVESSRSAAMRLIGYPIVGESDSVDEVETHHEENLRSR